MLTVARAAAEAAPSAVDRAAGSGPRRLRRRGGRGPRGARPHPEQLQVLRDAGVVDAGGRGLSVVLDAAETVLTGRRPPGRAAGSGSPSDPGPAAGRRPDRGRPGVRGDVPPRRRRRRDPGAAGSPRAARRLARRGRRRRAVERPRPRRRRRRRDRGRHRGRPAAPGAGHPLRRAGPRPRGSGRRARPAAGSSRSPRAGLAALFAEAGAEVVVGGPGRRPSTGDVLDAILATGAGRGGRPAQRPRLRPGRPGRRPAPPRATTASGSSVIPTQAQVQGLAALAVHEPGRAFDQDVARDDRRPPATPATARSPSPPSRRSPWPARASPATCSGVVEGDFAVVGDDLYAVAVDVLERLLGGGGELVTIVRGAGRHRRPGRALRGVRRGAPPARRRRGLRRAARTATRCWSGSSDHASTHPVASVFGKAHKKRKLVREGLGHRDRRRAALPLPAPLRRRPPSSATSTSRSRASQSRWSARSRPARSSRSGPPHQPA